VHYSTILKSTVGIVFMGTPHRGSDLVPWALLLGNIVNAAFLGQALRNDLIRGLHPRSKMLSEISKAFLHRSVPLKIMSFIELQIESPLLAVVSLRSICLWQWMSLAKPSQVVPEHSARLDLPNEIVYPVNAHHRNICRYSSKSDASYILVEAAIKEMVLESLALLNSGEYLQSS